MTLYGGTIDIERLPLHERLAVEVNIKETGRIFTSLFVLGPSERIWSNA